MKTAEELYYQFHLLLNKNYSSDNINISRGNFVILYNREAKSWLYNFLTNNKKTDDFLYLNELKEKDVELKQIENKEKYKIYELPKDYSYLIYGDCFSIGKKGNCKDVIYNRLNKPDNQNEYKKHEYSIPKFDWRRGLIDVAGDKLYVYKGDFEIDSTYISYYKNLTEIDLAGSEIELGDLSKQSVTINPKESDWILERVLDRVVTEVMRQFENSGGFQLSVNREQNK